VVIGAELGREDHGSIPAPEPDSTGGENKKKKNIVGCRWLKISTN
jgi:hypothetical protein